MVDSHAHNSHVQAYEQRRRKKDADREAAEAAQEAELARAAAARAAKQEAEAAEWMGQISVEEQGQEADEQQEGQVRLVQCVKAPAYGGARSFDTVNTPDCCITVAPKVLNGTDAVLLLRELWHDSHASHCTLYTWTELHHAKHGVSTWHTRSDCYSYNSKPFTGLFNAMQGLMGQFVEYIKEGKSVALEDLAAQFGLRVQVNPES